MRPRNRAFASSKNEHAEFVEQVKVALSLIKDEQGVPITQSKLIESIQVVNAKERSELLNVIIKINLTKDFRKVKAMVQDHLQKALPWANMVNVTIAPQKVETEQ